MAARDFAEMELEEYRRQKLEQRRRMAQPARQSPAPEPRFDPLTARRRLERTAPADADAAASPPRSHQGEGLPPARE